MRYAQFYCHSSGYVKGSIPPKFDNSFIFPIEAVGDRSVIIIDQRIKPETAGRIAEYECKKRGFIGWRMFEGNSFTQSKPVSEYWPIANKVDNTSFSANFGN